jgi:hypothetical protein
MVAQISYSVVVRSRGQVAPCAVCTVHVETRSAGFLVEPQKQSRQFVSGLASKPLRRFFAGLASKPVVTVSGALASKPAAMISGCLALKPAATVSVSLASKPVATVSTGLTSKPAAMVSDDLASKPAKTISCADVCAPTSISASPRSDSVVFVGLVFASARLLCSFFTAPVWFSSSAPARFSRRKPIGAVAKERTLDLWSTLSRTRAGGFWISTSACFGFSYLRFLFTVSIYPLPQCFAVW